MREGSLVFFHEVKPPKRYKTQFWLVYATADIKRSHALGLVRWWSPWRRYVFVPNAETLYDALCLTDIAAFCATETDKRHG